MITVIIILLVLFLVLLAQTIIESKFMLKVRHEELGGNIKIVHVADLHKRTFGKENIRLIQRISEEKPDVILISGDIVSRSCTEFSAVETLLSNMVKIAPVFMVLGNHENDLAPEFSTMFLAAVENSGVVLLRNESRIIEIRGRKLKICGLELESTVYKKNGSYRALDKLELSEINEKLGKKPEIETILLVHNPFFAEVYAQWGAEYAVCGHVHGGAARIPLTRIGLLSPERKLFPKYTCGVYTLGITKVLVSSGLGKLRLFNPPEIVVYKI